MDACFNSSFSRKGITPGASKKRILLSPFIFCTPFVCPLRMLVLAALLPFIAFIKDDLPTLGYPKTPTETLIISGYALFASITEERDRIEKEQGDHTYANALKIANDLIQIKSDLERIRLTKAELQALHAELNKQALAISIGHLADNNPDLKHYRVVVGQPQGFRYLLQIDLGVINNQRLVFYSPFRHLDLVPGLPVEMG